MAPLHTTTLCRGVSEVNANGDCNNEILWSKGSMCQAKCEEGYGFYDPPAKKYSCGAGGEWSPAGSAPECYRQYPLSYSDVFFLTIRNICLNGTVAFYDTEFVCCLCAIYYSLFVIFVVFI